MERNKDQHPSNSCLFLVDDGQQYWMDWGEIEAKSEEGHSRYKWQGHEIVVPEGLDFRNEICTLGFPRSLFGLHPEIFKIYRLHEGDLQAWSWGSLPGKRLDEAVISRLMQGGHVAQGLDHLQGEGGKSIDPKMILLILAAVVVIGFVGYKFVLPKLHLSKTAVATENTTAAQKGYWAQTSDNRMIWVQE
jgi:hypothetical protein